MKNRSEFSQRGWGRIFGRIKRAGNLRSMDDVKILAKMMDLLGKMVGRKLIKIHRITKFAHFM